MKPLLTLALAAAITTTTMVTTSCSENRANPFLTPYTTQFEIPPFEEIEYADFLPAVEKGIAEKREDIKAIVENPEAPTFGNTILALEKSGTILDRVMRVYSVLSETDNTPEMEAISEKLLPEVSAISDEIAMNPALFERVKTLYDSRDSLDLEPYQVRAIELSYQNFVRRGALLSDDDKATLTELNKQLTDLYLKYNKNLLAATNETEIVVTDEAELAGIPEATVAQAATEAKERGKEGQWVFTLHAPSRLPVLTYADSRALREQMYKAYTTLATAEPYDNRPVIGEIVKLRARKAALLGYSDFASYMTANVMAKTPEAARSLLMQIWTPAVKRANEEVAEMTALAKSEGQDITIEPWDYYYWNEKVRANKYNIDSNEVAAYFSLDNVRKGIFTLAERLYGVKFTELPDAPKYNPEVTVYEVTDADNGEHVAVFMTDYFPRATKRQGAWMDEIKGSFIDPDGTVGRPIIYNVGNFSRPAGDKPALLSMDEVETMFHEFGHGLHGMLSRAKLRSQSGTGVDRDFVELPSQITEHWAMEPELLNIYARHYETDSVIPAALIEKLNAASTHNMGFRTTELAGAALLDLYWGALNPAEGDTIDVDAFEAKVSEELGMPREITYRYRSPYFKHIFGSDGYASGYYTYLWAEVLDTDGFELFKEKGVFDAETARSFKQNVLEMGGSEDPSVLYERFRGHAPSVDALLRFRGLTK